MEEVVGTTADIRTAFFGAGVSHNDVCMYVCVCSSREVGGKGKRAEHDDT